MARSNLESFLLSKLCNFAVYCVFVVSSHLAQLSIIMLVDKW